MLRKIIGKTKLYKPSRTISLNSGYNIYLNKLYDEWEKGKTNRHINSELNDFLLCIVIVKNDKQALIQQTINSIKIINTSVKYEIVENTNSKEIINLINSRYPSGFWYIIIRAGDLLYPWAIKELLIALYRQNNKKAILFDHDSRLNEYSEKPHLKPLFNKRFLMDYDYIQNAICVNHNILTTIDHEELDIFEALYSWLINRNLHDFYHIRKPLISQGSEFKLRNFKILKNKNNLNIDRIKIFKQYQNVRFRCDASQLVSIIIPFRDKPELIKNCVNSIIRDTVYPNFEIILANNNSAKSDTKRLIKELTSLYNHVKVININSEFNFSFINNEAVKYSSGEILLFLNNDTETIQKGWLQIMVSELQQNDVGAVGPMLLYKDQTIQHAGVVPGIGHVAGHAFRGFKQNQKVDMNQINVSQEVGAVTGACLLTYKQNFYKIGCFDQVNLKIAYNDIDFCFKLLSLDKKIIYTPQVKLIHLESKSRKFDMSRSEKERYDNEVHFMKKNYRDVLTSNQFYHPAFTKFKEDYSFNQFIEE